MQLSRMVYAVHDTSMEARSSGSQLMGNPVKFLLKKETIPERLRHCKL